MALGQNAELVLTWLHGDAHSGPGPAKIAASHCMRALGARMAAAWAALAAAERRALRRLPPLNDAPPACVGVWSAGNEHAGLPVLRPALRQPVPPEYVPADYNGNGAATGDWQGRRYTAGHLLPAARAARRTLREVARRVVQTLVSEFGGGGGGGGGSGSSSEGAAVEATLYMPPLKEVLLVEARAGLRTVLGDSAYGGVATHAQHEFPRQASNVDVARCTIVLPTAAQLLRALELLRGQSHRVARIENGFADGTGGAEEGGGEQQQQQQQQQQHQLGYRDLALYLCIDGAYVELRLALAPLVAVRRQMHKCVGVSRYAALDAFVARAKSPPPPKHRRGGAGASGGGAGASGGSSFGSGAGLSASAGGGASLAPVSPGTVRAVLDTDSFVTPKSHLQQQGGRVQFAHQTC